MNWLDEEARERAALAVLVAGRRRLILVECASFDGMRRLGLNRAFTIDRHFKEQGLEIVPFPDPGEAGVIAVIHDALDTFDVPRDRFSRPRTFS